MVTSGPLVPGIGDAGEARDLEMAAHKPIGRHGISSSKARQDEET